MANQISSRAVLTQIFDSPFVFDEPTKERDLIVVVVGVPLLPRQDLALAHSLPARRLLPLASPKVHRRNGRRFDLRYLLLLPVATAGLWSALPSSRATNDRGLVRITLPPPSFDHPAAPVLARAAGVVPKAAVPQSREALAAPASDAVKQAQHPVRAGAALVAIDELPEVRAATVLALRSGVAQHWQANGLEGLLVAGPVQLQGSNVCRTIAVLADGGGGGQTVSSLRCMTRGGNWVRQPAPRSPEIAPGLGPEVTGPASADSGEVR